MREKGNLFGPFYFNPFSFGFLEILDYFDNINIFNSGWIDVESFGNIVQRSYLKLDSRLII